jgi:DNA replication protein DnaC
MEVSEQPMTCEQHGPYAGRVVNILDRKVVTSGCPECSRVRTDEMNRRAIAERMAQRRALVSNAMAQSRIPPRYAGVSMGAPTPATPDQERVYTRAQWFLDTWSERAQLGTSMVFVGRPGSGKTHLACALGHELCVRGVTVLFSSVADAMREIRETYNGTGRTEAQALKTFTRPKLLILDEVGASSGSDHEKQQLFEIVNRRYSELKNTILISNLELQALNTYLGDRLMDRMREGGGKLLSFNWESLRK